MSAVSTLSTAESAALWATAMLATALFAAVLFTVRSWIDEFVQELQLSLAFMRGALPCACSCKGARAMSGASAGAAALSISSTSAVSCLWSLIKIKRKRDLLFGVLVFHRHRRHAIS